MGGRTPCLLSSQHVLGCLVESRHHLLMFFLVMSLLLVNVIAYFEKKQPYVAVPWLWVPAYWHSGGLLAPVAP